MPYITNHKQKFDDLEHHLTNLDQLKRQANGGNSIIFSYPPTEELLYVNKARELFEDRACFIDISKLFVEYIDSEGWDSFKEYYLEFKTTPHLIFKSKDDSVDLFDVIIKKITEASKDNKIPFLIRTGVLFGTGIDNVNIMEHKSVMYLKQPLVFFYPSKYENGNLYFLNFKTSSKYRCNLVK